ncbi:TRAP transporter small permease subunit [Hyphomonas sp. WL0036]|uniref:TRAP transporter small permease subunit n=1 Tax=Hyphomonas sediminis TaxID=2866160 RepID=UPI001C81C191|nr:TRAP transporter small permease subunit [Hyphomonas sediminis]MBY9068383.1 TRAP transporter small permease subunit [Hyphomonas sediminis]
MDTSIFLYIGTGLKWLGIASLPLFLVPLIALSVPKLIDGFALKLSQLIDRVSGFALGGAVISSLVLVFAMLAVVILRYTFALSFSWLNEITTYAFAAMFMLGTAAALRDGAHVRVDILRPRFGETGRDWVELAGIYLFLFPICVRILMTSEAGLTRAWTLLEGSRESDGLPIFFLFKTLVPVFAVLLMAQGLSEAIKAALRLTGALPPETPEQLAAEGGGHGA